MKTVDFLTFVFRLLQIGEIGSWYLLPSRRTLHIRQYFRWTSEQPNLLQNIFLCCLNDLVPFYRHNSFCTVVWASSFYLSVKIVVLYQFTVTCIENFASKVKPWGLSDGKKGSRLRLRFWVVDDVPEKKGMDLWKQMSSSKCSFTCICGFFFVLRLFHDSLCSAGLLGLHFTWACVLLSVRSLCFTLTELRIKRIQSFIEPWIE